MSISRKIASNTAFQIFGKLATGASTLVTTILFTRYLGPKGFGEYSVVFSYIFSFLIIADFGINSIIVRDFSKDKRRVKAYFTSVLGLRVVLSIITALIALVILPYFPYSSAVHKAIFLGIILVLGHSIGSSCNIVFQTFLKYKFQFISSLSSSVAQILLVLLAVYLKASFLGLVAAVTLSSLILPTVSLYFTRKYINLKAGLFKAKYWKYVLFTSFPVGLGLFFNTMLTKEDITIMLPWLVGFEAVGLYSIGNKLFENLLTFPNFFMNAAFPLFVQHRKESEEKLKRTVQLSFDSLALLGAPLIVGSVVLAPQLINLIGGSEFLPGVLSFRILIFSSLVFFVSPIYRWLIIVMDEHKKIPYIYGAALVVDFVLNLIFIPKYGIVAAAVITGISESVVLGLSFYLTYKILKFIPNFKNFLRGLIAAVIMIIPIYLTRDLLIVFPVALGLVSYLIFIYVFGIFKQPNFRNLLPKFS